MTDTTATGAVSLTQLLRVGCREMRKLADALHRTHVSFKDHDGDPELRRRTYMVATKLNECATDAQRVADELDSWAKKHGLNWPASHPVAAATTAPARRRPTRYHRRSLWVGMGLGFIYAFGALGVLVWVVEHFT